MSKSCLLITERFEPTADWLLEELRHRHISGMRWNMDRFPIESSLTFRAFDNRFTAEICTDGRTVDLETVGSIWCRGVRPSGLPDAMVEPDKAFAQSECQRVIDSLMTVTRALWVNHPGHHARANAKPAQLFAAQQVGLEIPPTVITNQPERVREFMSEFGGGATIYKAMSQNLGLQDGKALFTGLVTDKELGSLDLIRVSPGIFQRLIPKAYEVRATVVGSRIFSARIDSQAREETKIDWRHRPFDVDESPVELPAVVQDRIHALMRAFGLVYGALDFIVTPDQRYVFLEVNPAGQYMWVETQTGLPITSALVDVLAEVL